MEGIVEKTKALRVAANKAQPANAKQLLDELNAHFSSLREDFSFLLPEELAKQQNRAMYSTAQRTFHEICTENANVAAPTEAIHRVQK